MDFNEKEREYLSYLIHQFHAAKSEKVTNVILPKSLDNFNCFIKERRCQAGIYRKFLEQMKISYQGKETCEIGKGTLDSIVFRQTKTSMVTPYINTDELENESQMIMTALVEEREGHLYCLHNHKEMMMSNYQRYMTENPYESSMLSLFQKIHLSGGVITVGVYGGILDKDRNEKLTLMREFRKRLDARIVILDDVTFQNTYVSIVSTKTEEMEKTKEGKRGKFKEKKK